MFDFENPIPYLSTALTHGVIQNAFRLVVNGMITSLEPTEENINNIIKDLVAAAYIDMFGSIDVVAPYVVPNAIKELGKRAKLVSNEDYVCKYSKLLDKLGDEEYTVGSIILTKQKDRKGELSILKVEPKSSHNQYDTPCVGINTEEISYWVMGELGVTDLNGQKIAWMSMTPSSANTMTRDIKAASGRCLVYGLGLGYYVYSIASKRTVESVTVIERNPDIIKMWNDVISKVLDKRIVSKINIIEGDAFEHIDTVTDNDYDFIYWDVWLGTYDVNPYVTAKGLSRRFEKTNVSFWLDDVFTQAAINALQDVY